MKMFLSSFLNNDFNVFLALNIWHKLISGEMLIKHPNTDFCHQLGLQTKYVDATNLFINKIITKINFLLFWKDNS